MRLYAVEMNMVRMIMCLSTYVCAGCEIAPCLTENVLVLHATYRVYYLISEPL